MVYVIDIETYDPLLLQKGPSIRFGEGNLLCAVVNDQFIKADTWTGKLTDDGTPKFRKASKDALKPIADVMASSEAKVFANAGYELAWFYGLKLWSEKAHRKSFGSSPQTEGRIYDVLIDETLLQGTIVGGLDAVAKSYGFEGKPIDALVEGVCSRMESELIPKPHRKEFQKAARAIRSSGGRGRATKTAKTQTDVRAWLWVLTADDEGWALLEEYNRHDVDVTAKVHQEQAKRFHEIQPIQTVESLFIPVLALMESRGVPVSMEGMQKLHKSLTAASKNCDSIMQAHWGRIIDTGLPDADRAFLDERYKFERTDTGKAAINKKTLKQVNNKDEALKAFEYKKKLQKIESTFLRKMMQVFYNNRVFPRIFQIGTDAGGTKTGRLSYQIMNLQQFPKLKDDDLPEEEKQITKSVRQMIHPEPNHVLISADYASQEPRLQAHAAIVYNAPGARELQEAYIKDPFLSLHEWVKDLCNNTLAAKGYTPFMKKSHAKPINLGIPYGSGVQGIIDSISPDSTVGSAVFEAYKQAFPAVLWLRNMFQRVVEKKSLITTGFGRRSSFPTWEVDPWKLGRMNRWSRKEIDQFRAKGAITGSYDALAEDYPRHCLTPSRAYSGLNRYIQGTAADQTKGAMVRMYYRHKIVPLLQLHDEIIIQTLAKKVDSAIEAISDSMLNVLDLCVPVVIEYEVYEAGWASRVVKQGKAKGENHGNN